MGVYISGMEMPQDREKLYMIVFSDGKACASYKPFEWHEVVSVPPHGRLLKVLKTERECVSRDCNRDCGKCDLSLEQDEILSAYDTLIALFAGPAEEGE